jgi:hypothetical protein
MGLFFETGRRDCLLNLPRQSCNKSFDKLYASAALQYGSPTWLLE